MEKKRVDEQEAAPVSLPKVDRFGFVKQDGNTPDGLTKSRTASEFERYSVYESIFSFRSYSYVILFVLYSAAKMSNGRYC